MDDNKKSTYAMELRKKAGLSQTAVAAALGLSEKSVSNWEAGRNEPRLSFAQTQKLIELYNCELKDLVVAFPPLSTENAAKSEDRSASSKIPVAS